jgi:hypothetical protein
MAPGPGMSFAGSVVRSSTVPLWQADLYKGESNVKFLAVSTNTKDVSPFIAAEFQHLEELRAAGTVTGGWVKADFSGAVLVLECADEAEATAALGTLPIVVNDATDFVVTEVVDLDSVRPGVA